MDAASPAIVAVRLDAGSTPPKVIALDQNKLPETESYVSLLSADDVADAIRRNLVRPVAPTGTLAGMQRQRLPEQ